MSGIDTTEPQAEEALAWHRAKGQSPRDHRVRPAPQWCLVTRVASKLRVRQLRLLGRNP
jgi:hypothetical protein